MSSTTTAKSGTVTKSAYPLSIGIIGAGAIGSAFAKALANKGIQAVISNSRGPASLTELARELGPSIKAGTREEAAAQDIVLVAVNWSRLEEALEGLPDFDGRIVIDANNPVEAPLFKPAELHGRLSSEVVSLLVPSARVVKAFNHLQAHLVSHDPTTEGGRRIQFYSGDDEAAKNAVGSLIDQLGFFGIDLGPLNIGAKLTQFPGGPLPALNLVKFA